MENYPVCVMVGVASTWSGLTCPYLFLKGEGVNGQTYHDQLLPLHKEEGKRLFEHKNWGFQQDGTDFHTANKAQKWCKQNLNSFIPKEKWSSNSSEFNSLNYSSWDSTSNHVKYHKVKAISDLPREVEKVTKKDDINCVQEVTGAFLRRVYSVEKDGDAN